MSVNLYDKALLEKLNNWTKDSQLHIVGPDESRRLWELVADENNDHPMQLPMIVLARPGGYTILEQGLGKVPLSHMGARLDATDEKSIILNAIPISITYQIDVYTRYFEEADEYTRNLVFNIVNYPKVTITIPYRDKNYKHDSNIRLDGTVEDNSGIPERLVAGQFTRMTLRLTMDDAYLWDVSVKDNWQAGGCPSCSCVSVVAKDEEIKDK